MERAVNNHLIRALDRIPGVRRRSVRTISPAADWVLEVAEEHNFPVRVLGLASMLQGRSYNAKWWLLPLDQWRRPLPDWVEARKEAIEQSGVAIQGWVLCEEKVEVLNPGPTRDKPVTKLRQLSAQLTAQPILLVGLGILAAIILPVLIQALVSALLGFLGAVLAAVTAPFVVVAVAGAVVADPRLIVVVDGVWIEVARWE